MTKRLMSSSQKLGLKPLMSLLSPEIANITLNDATNSKMPDMQTADDIMDRYAAALIRMEQDKQEIEDCRAILTQLRKDGIIGDKLDHPTFSLTWRSTSRWTYSAAVKQLQEMEQIEGIATKSTSGSFAAIRKKPKRS